MSAARVAEEFFDAWTGGNFDRARELLGEDGFRFEGPIDTFDDRDSYLASLEGLAAIVTGAERLKVSSRGRGMRWRYDPGDPT